MTSWYFRTAVENLRSALVEIGEPRQLVLACPHCGDNKIIMARQVKKEEVETNPIFSEFLQVSRCNSPSGFVRQPSRVSTRSRGSCRHKPGHKCPSLRKRRGSKGSGVANANGDTKTDINDDKTTTTTTVKNGSNGRANSIHMMEGMKADEAAGRNSHMTLQERWQKFVDDRSDYSLWLFKSDHP